MKLPKALADRAEKAEKALTLCQSTSSSVVECWKCPYDGSEDCIREMQEDAAAALRAALQDERSIGQ